MVFNDHGFNFFNKSVLLLLVFSTCVVLGLTALLLGFAFDFSLFLGFDKVGGVAVTDLVELIDP